MPPTSLPANPHDSKPAALDHPITTPTRKTVKFQHAPTTEPSPQRLVPQPNPTRKRTASSPTSRTATKRVIALPDYKPPDSLGTLIADLSDKLVNAASWEEFFLAAAGDNLLHPDVQSLPHPAADYLHMLATNGAPAKTDSEPWTLARKRECIARGPHTSAREFQAFIRDEMHTNINSKYWVVLPYHLVEHYRQLKLSPLGIKEERDRRPRLVVDHSFYGVNEETLRLSPEESMQYGSTLHRLLFRIRHADPRHGPVYLAKYDVTDGFYNIRLNPSDALMLATIIPKHPDEPQCVAIPLALTMGWTESPPTFCTVTETACDLINWNAHQAYLPPHRLEPLASATDNNREPLEPVEAPTVSSVAPKPLAPSTPAPTAWESSDLAHQGPLRHTDIFVDDFIQLHQGAARQRQMYRRLLLHTIDQLLLPNPNAPDSREERVSVKKLLKGEGSWTTRKDLLGWHVDTVRQTLELPVHRQDKLRTLFQDLRNANRISVPNWQSIIGQLRFVAPGVPGSPGLFSALQLGLKHQQRNRVRIDRHLRAHLLDFEALVLSLGERPTRLGEIVPDLPRVIGTTDACGHGLGGVIFTADHPPTCWRWPLPADIQSKLISPTNPNGTISINDLEQAAAVIHHDVVSRRYDVRERTIANLVDNITTASRFRKGAVTSADPGAYLCCLHSAHQRHNRYCSETSYIPGDANVMSDDSSRLQHLSDTDLLARFNTLYPQSKTWQIALPNSGMLTSVMQALAKQRPDPVLWQQPAAGEKASGRFGVISVPSIVSPRPSKGLKSPKHISQCLLSEFGAASLPPAVCPSALARYRQPFSPLERKSNGWLTKTHASTKGLPISDRSSATCSRPTNGKTLTLNGSGLSRPASLKNSSESIDHPAGHRPASTPHETSATSPSSSSSAQANTAKLAAKTSKTAQDPPRLP